MTEAPPSRRLRPIALGVVLPGLLLLAGFLRAWTWLPRIPDPAVLHWGTGGADRTGPFTQILLVLAVLSLVTWLPAAVLTVLAVQHPVGRRLSAGVSAGMGALYAGIVVVTALPQLDAPSAADVEVHWARTATVRAEPAWWTAGAAWTLGALALGYATSQWWLIAVLIVPAVLVLGSLSWTVRIDRAGLHARALLGLPRLTVRLAEIERADVAHVRPFAEFGGWGLRMRPDGTTGLVTRSGSGLRILTSGERVTVVTVPDAGHASALLNTMAEQSRL